MKGESMTDFVKNEAKQFLEDYVSTHLTKSKGDLYQCPFCGSGSRGTRDSDGAFGLYPKSEKTKWKCQACDHGGDIFDLVAKLEGIPESEAFQRVAERYNLENNTSNNDSLTPSTQWKKESAPKNHENAPPQDFSQYLEQWHKNLLQGQGVAKQYVLGRGLTEETINRFNIGVDGTYLTIPYNRGGTYYTKRNINPSAGQGERHRKPPNSNAGEEPVFNESVLYTEGRTPVFVVEGALCAISIMQEGGQAIAIGGTGSKKIETVLREKKSEKILVLCLDNDQAGVKATKTLEQLLISQKQTYFRFNVSGIYKDPNEHLQADRESFKALVGKVTQFSPSEIQEQITQTRKENSKEHRESKSAKSHVQGFINGIADSINTPYISTGFPSLDKQLDGGLYEGLYIIGAISSLGKTTFSLQIADYIAKSGQDVLFFSLEMARSEVMAKSISRETAQEVVNSGGNMRNAKTTRGITTGKKWGSYSKEEKEIIGKAVSNYEQYAENLFIYEGIGDIGIEQITEEVKTHIAITGEKPVVMIDYLQIIAPYEARATDKQNTDKAVLELKRMSRDHKVPVFAISSFNRENYRQAVNMASFKESGAIEYSSDVLIGLQYLGMDEKGIDPKGLMEKNAQNAKEGRAVNVELKILKNRNGAKGNISLDFYPMFNMFDDKEGR